MKGVIFDMDGVIIDSEPIHTKLEKDLFGRIRWRLFEDKTRGFYGDHRCSDVEHLVKNKFGLAKYIDVLLMEKRLPRESLIRKYFLLRQSIWV